MAGAATAAAAIGLASVAATRHILALIVVL